MAKKIIVAVPQTSLKLFEVEVTGIDIVPTNERLLELFKKQDKVLDERYLSTVGVGEYRNQATVFAEVPEKIQ